MEKNEKEKVILEMYKARLEKVYSDKKHPIGNLTIIKRFMRKVEHSGVRYGTLKADYAALTVFSRWCTIPIMDLTEDDIYDYLDSLKSHTFLRHGERYSYSDATIHNYKIILKKFFKIIGKPELLDSLKERRKKENDEKIEREKLLTKEDIESLINATMNPRDKAIIATLYESGARRGELLAVKRKHIVFDDYGVKLTFPDGKTGKRTVRLVYAASYIRAWVDAHPIKNADGEMDMEADLFVSLHLSKNKEGELVYEKLTDVGLYLQIQKIAKRIGLNKKVNPHAFRHSRATDLASHLTEQQMKNFLGWSPDSKMCAVYVHNPETENAILKMNGIMIEDTYTDGLRVGRCPRCKELNPENFSFCGKCGLPFTEEAAKTVGSIMNDYTISANQAEITAMKNELKGLKQTYEEELLKLKEITKNGR